MDLHPGPESRRVLEVRADEIDPIRRALYLSEDWYQDLIQHSQDFLCMHDLEGRILSVNPAPARVLGYSIEELLQIPLRDILALQFRPQFDVYLRQLEETRESSGLMSVATRSGERRIWRYHSVLRSQGVPYPTVRVTAYDVTEQTSAERKLLASRAEIEKATQEQERTLQELKLFRALLDQSSDAITVVDPETLRYLDVNQRACIQLGYSREELLSRTVYDVAPGFAKSMRSQMLRQIRQSGSAIIEEVNRRKDGSTFPVEMTLRDVHLGRKYGVAISRDITARKEAEARFHASESRYRALHDISPAGISWIDRRGRFLKVNARFCEIVGRAEPELLKCDFQTITHPEDLKESVEKLRQHVSNEVQHSQIEKRYVRPDGSIRWVEAGFASIPPLGNEEPWYIAMVQDITDRKQAEEALGSSEEKYRLFVSQSSEGIFREDPDVPIPINLPEDQLVQRILHDHSMGECNDALAAMYGMTSREQLRGKRLTELLVADDPHNIELTRHYIRSGFRVIDRESHEVDIHGNPKVFLNSMIGTVENGMLVRTWGIQRDITERVKLEKAREEAEKNLRETVAQLQSVTDELRMAKEKLSEEKLYLEEAIDTELGFGEIVGRSSALKEVMGKITRVAGSDATVLLLGETGTGKELAARALHRLSQRREGSFIKMNCAAIPSGLLESELFGHEKGAFTGAVARKIGRLELADKGTLFLDEIGEIPLSLQPKLLRVLQDREFERLGGTQTMKVDFRLLAATNRDLLQSVKAREFRSDLYYRLNVFPILLPPLHERREDIRPLIEHFVRKFAAQMKKSVSSVPSKTMETLVRWEWPGNIRELENFVERSVILTQGSVLQAPLAELQFDTDHMDGVHRNTESLCEVERERIIRALRACQGKLGGADGAAAQLGLKRTTLQSKLDHLGIKPATFRQ